MKHLLPRTVAAAFVAASFAVAAQPAPQLQAAKPESAGMSSERLGKLTAAFRKDIDDGKLPGAVMAIARRGKLVYYDALGWQDKAGNVPMKKDAVFRIYSMTKPLVSVAALILIEDGRMHLTDPVSKFFPAFAKMQVSVPTKNDGGQVTWEQVPAARQMTVQDLLRHTAGLAYGEITTNAPVKEALQKAGMVKPNVIDFDARDMTPAEQVERLSKIALIHQPGTFWEYSLASDLLGRVVEAASGKRLGDFMEERIFRPLGMKDTAFHVPAPKRARLAQPFAKDPGSGAPIVLIDVSEQPKNDSGGAGAVSTAMDYLRFSQAMLRGGALDGRRVLSPTTVKLAAADHFGDRIKMALTPGELLMGTPGYTFGLGFMVRQGPGVAGVHGSAGEYMWGGYGGTFFWIDPQQELAAVLMTQQPGPIRQYYRRHFKQLVYQSIVD